MPGSGKAIKEEEVGFCLLAAENDTQGFRQPGTKIEDNWKQTFFLLLF